MTPRSIQIWAPDPATSRCGRHVVAWVVEDSLARLGSTCPMRERRLLRHAQRLLYQRQLDFVPSNQAGRLSADPTCHDGPVDGDALLHAVVPGREVDKGELCGSIHQSTCALDMVVGGALHFCTDCVTTEAPNHRAVRTRLGCTHQIRPPAIAKPRVRGHKACPPRVSPQGPCLALPASLLLLSPLAP